MTKHTTRILRALATVVLAATLAPPASQAQIETNIATAKFQTPGNYFPDNLTNTAFTVTGIVTSPNFGSPPALDADVQFYIQDPNDNVGIKVFYFDEAPPDDLATLHPTLEVGDEVEVFFGFIDQFRGEREIIPDDLSFGLTILNDTPAPLDPITNTIAALLASAEDNEGTLFKIENVDVATGSFPPLNSSSSGSLTITDATDSITLYIDSATDADGQLTPTNTFDLVGILGQNDGSATPTSNYRIVARYYSDIIQDVPADSPPELVLTPSGQVTVGEGDEVVIHLLGQDRNAGDVLTFGKTNAFGVISNLAPREAEFTWTIPLGTEGTTDVTLTVFDGITTVSDTVAVLVAPIPTNFWDFEGWMQGWTPLSRSSDIDWTLLNGTGAESTASYMYMNGFNADVPSDDWLISPSLDLTVYSIPRMSFWKRLNHAGFPTNLTVMVSTDYTDGEDPELDATWEAFPIPDPYPEGDELWLEYGVPLTNYTGSSDVRVAFRYVSGPPLTDMHSWRIDQIRLGETPPNVPPAISPPLFDVGVVEGNTVAFPVTAYEPNGDVVTLTMSPASVSNATFTATNGPYAASGLFSITPDAGQVGIVTVDFIASDVDGADTNTVNITVASAVRPCGLIISEYIEGSSNNKAVELFNGSPFNIDLGGEDYAIDIYFNGNATATAVPLSGFIPVNATYVIAHPSADPTLIDKADQVSTVNFNGNDALVLRQASTVVDSFGRVGEDPPGDGTDRFWGTAPVTTKDQTLIRKASIKGGDTIFTDPFDPADEYTSTGVINDFTDTGMHTSDDCPQAGPLPPVFAPAVGDHTVSASNLLQFAVSATEPNGDTIALTTIGLPTNATFATTDAVSNVSGLFSWTPDITQTGQVVVTFVATDIDGSDTNFSTITVEAVEPPVGTNTAGIMVSEIMQNPSAVLDSAGEYFEIYNNGTNAVDINGWTIRDDGTDSHVIAAGGALIIPTNGFVVLGRNANSGSNGGVPVDYQYASFTLGNSGDEVILQDAALQEIDRVEYDGGPNFPDPNGASMELVSPDVDNNVGANWATATTSWPGSAGDLGSPGDANELGDWSGGPPPTDQPPEFSPPLADKAAIAGNTLQFAVIASEIDGDLVTLSASNIPANATFPTTSAVLSVTNVFSFTPDTAQTGVVAVTFIASDKDGTNTSVVNITVHPPRTCGLIISEYIEGSGNNKALELYNGSSSAIDLDAGNYVIDMYNNGTSTVIVTTSVSLTGTVASGGTFLIANLTTNAPPVTNVLLNAADQLGQMFYNGDDTVVLRQGGSHTGVVVDSIGRIGEDPGAYWGTPPTATKEQTLIRMPSIKGGDVVIDDPYDPADEWIGLPQDTFTNIQMHTSDVCPPSGGVDTDGDGIPDDWETTWCGGPTNCVATDDIDLDTFNYLEEYIADTDPTDSNSLFKITELANTGTTFGVKFPSSAARLYLVESTTNIVNTNFWIEVEPESLGNGGVKSVIDISPDDDKQYRGNVRVP